MNGEQTLNAARAHLQRFVRFPSQAALDVATIWCAHTHCVDQKEHLLFDTTPRIAFVSDIAASGKTAALDLVGRLALNGQRVIDPTPATYASMVDEDRNTILVDEVDVLFGMSGNAKQTLRSLLNAGYKRGTFWKRANKSKVDVFAPLALAGLGAKFRTAPMLEPLRTRSIIIEMRPVIRTDDAASYEVYRPREHDALTDRIRADLSRWARTNAALISQTWPQDIPDGIDNRLREVCEPLFQVADAAQGHWPASIRAAAAELLLGEVSESTQDELSLSEQLLADLRSVYADAEKMSTMDITAGLYALPSSTWAKLWPNRNTAPRELAMMLAPLGVEPQPVDLDGHTLRGYHRWALEPHWRDEEITSLAVS